MPSRIPVSLLSDLAFRQLRKTILEFLKNHNVLSCKYCSNNYLNEDCLYLKNFKAYLQDIPDVLKERLFLDKSLMFLYENKPFQRKYENIYLLTWILECNSLKISYISFEDMGDWHFAKKYGKYIYSICLYYTRALLNVNCLGPVLHQTSNLKIIDFGRHPASGFIMKVVGKQCNSLKKIHAVVDEIDGLKGIPMAYARLLYKDYLTKVVKYPCCNTLEVIDITVEKNMFYDSDIPTDFPGTSSELFSSMIKVLYSMFTDVPNLKYLGKVFSLDCIVPVLASKSNFVSKIEDSYCQVLTAHLTEQFGIVLPQLKVLHIDLYNNVADALSLLSSIPSVTTLIGRLEYGRNDYLIYSGILRAEWANLRDLYLDRSTHQGFDDTFLDKFNVSVFAKSLPKLEKLSIPICCDVIWNNEAVFNCLQYLKVVFDGKNREGQLGLEWFKSFSETIVEMEFENVYCIRGPSVSTDALGNISFPLLEKLSFFLIKMDLETVMEFLNNCERIHLLETIELSEEDGNSLLSYLKENNIDCKIDVRINND